MKTPLFSNQPYPLAMPTTRRVLRNAAVTLILFGASMFALHWLFVLIKKYFA